MRKTPEGCRLSRMTIQKMPKILFFGQVRITPVRLYITRNYNIFTISQTYPQTQKDSKHFRFESFFLPRQLPTFPGRHQPSIISVTELNCRVRNGNGCVLCAIATESLNTILSFSYLLKYSWYLSTIYLFLTW